MFTKKIISDCNQIDISPLALLEALPDAVYLIDTEGVILNTNTLFAAQFGKEPEECIGLNVYDLIATVLQLPELAASHKEKSKEVLHSGKRIFFIDELDVRKVTITPIALPEGERIRLLVTIQDISDQKPIKKESKQACALKNAVLESIPGATFIIDSNWHLKRWNQYTRDFMFGKTDDEMQGIDPFEFFTPDDSAALREKFRNILHTGVDDGCEVRFFYLGGTHCLWLLIRAKRVFIDDQWYVLVIGINITERKRMESELTKNQARFRKALEAARAGVWERELETNNVFWSDTMWPLFGLNRSSQQPSFELWSSLVHPDDREKVIKDAAEATSKGTDLDIEYRVCHPDGSVHWLMSSGKPLHYKDGRATHYIGTIFDISNQKIKEIELNESKIRYGHALNASHAGIWEWNAKTDELSWSEQVWRLYGLNERSVALNNQLCVDTIHPDDREMASWIIRDALSKGLSTSLEYRTCHPDGSVHWLISRSMPLYDADGQLDRYIGTIIDITERKEIEIALAKSKKKLRMALEASLSGVWEWDLTTNKNSCSEEIWTLFGLKRSDENITFDFWANTVHPDDRQSTIKSITASVQHKADLNIQYRVVYPDGSIHWLMARGKPQINEKGNTTHYLGTIIDITNQKNTECELTENKKRLTFALEATNTGVWEWNVNTDNVIWTDNVWKLYGLEQNSQSHTHKLCESNIYPDDRDLTFEKVMAAASKELKINIEYRVKHPDGSIHWLMCRGVPTYTAAGQLTCYTGTVTDVTSSKEVLNNILDGKIKLKQALKAARAGIWEWNPTTGENSWSDETWLLYGLEKGNLIPSFELWASIIHPDDRKMAIQTVSKSADNKAELYVEYRISHLNGSTHWLLSRGQPLFDIDGNVERYIGTIIDITERKEIEEERRRSQERLNFILKNSHIGVWDMDLRNGTTARTLEHAHIFGYETIPPVWSLVMFFDHIIPEDRTGIEDLVRRAIEKKESYAFECRIHSAKGELRWIRVTGAFMFDKQSNSSHILGIVQDITDKKLVQNALRESELKFRTIFDHSPVAIGISGLHDGKILDINDSWQQIFGYTKEEVIGQTLKDLRLYIQNEDYENYVTTLNEHGKIVNKPFLFRKKNGEPIHVLYFGEYITLKGKECILVMMSDITLQEFQQVSIARLEQIVTDRTRQLSEKVEHLRRFINMISHEYRTPLAIIRGNLDLIDLKIKSGKSVNQLEMNKINRAIARLVDVMEVSIDESRINEFQPTFNLVKFRIAPVIATQIEAFLAMWSERTILYTDRLDTSEIVGEPSQLKLAIYNLLDNARKYSPPDSPIELESRIEDGDVVIKIRNQGGSITDDEGEAFFEKYRRGSNSMNTGGAGIGLWLVRSIISHHKGQVTLTGMPSGVEATVRLPLDDEAE